MKKIILITIAIAISGALHAATYYVAKNGNNTNPGTLALPWLTIQKGANTAVAGDIVYVKKGIYNELVTPQNSGTSGNYITFSSYPGDTATIDGNGINISWGGLFDLRNKSYIKVSGFRITKSDNAGIFMFQSSNIIIEHNIIENSRSSCIGAQGSIVRGEGVNTNIIVDGNECNRIQWYPPINNSDPYAEGISMGALRGISEIKNNKVHNNNGESIDLKDGCQDANVYKNEVFDGTAVGIYIDGYADAEANIKVYQNKIHDIGKYPSKLGGGDVNNGFGMSINVELGGSTENVDIYNNLIYNIALDGIGVGIYQTPGQPIGMVKNIKIQNNTMYNTGTYWGGAMTIGSDVPSDVIEVYNNIFYAADKWLISVGGKSSNVTINTNLGNDNSGTGFGGTNFIRTDPMFVNQLLGNFHLQTSSPAIDNGLATGAPAFDFDGNSRPQGVAYDIGAYEYVTPTAVGYENKIENNIIIYPNPAQGKAQIEFNLTEKQNVQITLYNVIGKELGTVANSEINAGTHKVDISDYLKGAGVYIIRVKAGNSVSNMKLVNFK